jgi:arsenate reductase
MLRLMKSDALKVLVLCTGNSCRSVMAEALINDLGRGRYQAWSAGSVPAGYVHPKSIETLNRHGINPGQPRSKSWNEFTEQSFQLVITVCDQAAGESCPLFTGNPTKLHWSMPDPAKVTGSDANIDVAFDKVFFMLKNRIEEMLSNPDYWKAKVKTQMCTSDSRSASA